MTPTSSWTHVASLASTKQTTIYRSAVIAWHVSRLLSVLRADVRTLLYRKWWLQLGDPFVDLRDAQLPRGWSNVSFECSASTTSQFTSNIHIVAEALHMHNTGQMMSNELIRNGEVVRTTATDFFNFNFQGLVPEARQLRHRFGPPPTHPPTTTHRH